MVNSLSSRLPAPPAITAAPRATVRTVLLSSHTVLAALGVAVFLVFAVVVMTSHSTRGIVLANDRVAHAQRTVVLASQLVTSLNEAETNVRHFLRTGDETHLTSYTNARARYPRELADLQAQLAPRLELATMAASLRTLLDAKFAEFVHSLDLYRNEGRAAALAIALSEEGERNSGEIRSLLQTLQGAELDDLAEQADTVARRAESFHSLGLGFAELAVALAALAGWLLLRRTRSLERVAKICAWTRRVRWGEEWISFEEYLARRFHVNSTHGICEEAAQRMEREIIATPIDDLAENRPAL